MRMNRMLGAGAVVAALGWSMGCGVDGSLTFVPDATFNGTGQAGASGSSGASAGGAAGQGQAGQVTAGGAPAGGAGGKAMFDPKCVTCLSNQCPVLLGQCASDTMCVECVLASGGPACPSIPAAVALRGCACLHCEAQCDLTKCDGGMGGAGGKGGAGQAGVGGTTGGVGGTTGGVGGTTGGVGGTTGGVGGSTGGVGGAAGGCGNGVIDGSEECDGALPPGQKSCAEYTGDPLSKGKIFCTAACTVNASDCHACGDGNANPDEDCDGGDLKGQTCLSLGKLDGTLGCSTCKYDFSQCNGVAPVCGDGVINEFSEECDGQDLGNETCATVLGAAYEGPLSCSNCFLDTFGCHRKTGLREGPVMATIPKGGGTSGTISVDTTEVTVGQYEYFLQHVPGNFGLPPFCSFQGSSPVDFEPDQTCLGSVVTDGADGPADVLRLPAVCVDFCDALAYCQWAGKTLCGGVNKNPPNAPWDMLNDSTQNAWTAACTANGASPYPYGSTYEIQTCNDDGIGLQEVGTRGGCHSPTPGFNQLRDMSGNAGEWQDACQGGMGGSDLCAVRGGIFSSGPDALKCANPHFEARATVSPAIGFRCCEVTGAPPPP